MNTTTAHPNSLKGHRKTPQTRRKQPPSSSWCCSFKSPPKSPETLIKLKPHNSKILMGPTLDTHLSKSLPSSPQSSKSGLSLVGRIDPRRILSPGRVSPIDNELVPPKISNVVGVSQLGLTRRGGDVEERESDCDCDGVVDDEADVSQLGLSRGVVDVEERESDGYGEFGDEVELSQLGSTRRVDDVEERESDEGVLDFDVRLSLKGKNGGGFLILELNSKVLRENSSVFEGLIRVSKKNGGFVRIEVPEVENLGVYRETLELMFEDDITKKLIKFGAFRTIDILEVSASIKFNRGVFSCLKYLEAVPWTEEEEEKLRRLFARFKFDDATNTDIFSRLNLNDSVSSHQNLARQIVHSITTCGNVKARNELKSMVKGLLSQSSVYEKETLDISKEDLYSISQCCVSSLVTLFEEATDTVSLEQGSIKKAPEKSLIESISWQVENINWLLEILLERQIAEDFVDIWAHQKDLLAMHQKASPMVRYELSRVSAVLFVAMGTRKLQCQAELRLRLLNSWFDPMLLDFGWLQRCRKGLNVRELEEAMGHSLLTLPLKHQYGLFMEWFRCFSKHGAECPNLSKAFQIWWRRSFLRGSETHSIESR